MTITVTRQPSPLPSHVADDLTSLQTEAYAPTGMKCWSAQDFIDLSQNPFTWVLTASPSKNPSHITGYMVLTYIPGEAEILSIAVNPSLQKKGVATELINFLKIEENIPQLKRVILEVAENNINAIKFYQSKGFNILGRRKGYYTVHGKRFDAILMKMVNNLSTRYDNSSKSVKKKPI